jgi:hypothetical protein
MITPPDVMAQPKGQAFALLEGGQLWKIRMPLPDASYDPHIPENLAQIAEAMTRKYTMAEHGWRESNRTG